MLESISRLNLRSSHQAHICAQLDWLLAIGFDRHGRVSHAHLSSTADRCQRIIHRVIRIESLARAVARRTRGHRAFAARSPRQPLRFPSTFSADSVGPRSQASLFRRSALAQRRDAATLLVARNKLAAPVALWIARQTAQTLEALHVASYVHGDVNPRNLYFRLRWTRHAVRSQLLKSN